MATSARPPLRRQLADRLRGRILAGEHRPGDRLPSEPELAEGMGVSRATVRAAITLLEEERYLRREHGSGTFVTARPTLRNELGQNFGVTEMIERAGRLPATVDECAEVQPAGEEVAAALGLELGAPVSVLDRIRTSDGRPVVASTDWCRIDDLPPEELGATARGSLYDGLAARGLVIHHGVSRLTPETADGEVAERLGVARGALLMLLWQIDYGASGRPVLVSREFHLADAFEFTVYRRGPGETEG